jgi:RNA recognition motif-containing protein
MENKIYVGSLSYDTTDDGLNTVFSAIGTVLSAVVIKDRETGRSKGFGFVEMESEEDVQKAIDALDGSELDGRKLRVNKSVPQEKGSFGRSNGGGYNRR